MKTIQDLEDYIALNKITPLRLGIIHTQFFARVGLLEGLGDTLEEALLNLIAKINKKGRHG